MAKVVQSTRHTRPKGRHWQGMRYWSFCFKFIPMIAIIIQVAVAPLNYQDLGCYVDGSDGQRDLPYDSISNSALSLAMCILNCLQNGYAFAGAQNSSQCYCGNVFGGQGPVSNCSMSCSGNTNEVCGGVGGNSIMSTTNLVIPYSLNIAFGCPASQSSDFDFPAMVASKAVDGNTDPVLSDGYCSCTDDKDSSSWWMVDLKTIVRINIVRIYNRGDRGFGMRDFIIGTTNYSAPEWSSFVSPEYSLCASYPSTPSTYSPMVFTASCLTTNIPGQYVFIQLQSLSCTGSYCPQHYYQEGLYNYLHLCEVEIFTSAQYNLVLQLPASTNASGSNASLAVDGVTCFASLSSSSSAMGVNDWWMVDLGRTIPIGSAQLFYTGAVPSTNVAFSGSCAQSSTGTSSAPGSLGPASLAVDSYRIITCSQTSSQPGVMSWWAVNMGQVMFVHRVFIFTNSVEWSNITVGLTNDAPANNAPDPGNFSLCSFYSAALQYITINCQANTEPGQYLIIQMSETNQALILCDVEVYADVLPFVIGMTTVSPATTVPMFSSSSLNYSGTWSASGECRELTINFTGSEGQTGRYLVVMRANGSTGSLGLNEVEAFQTATPLPMGTGNVLVANQLQTLRYTTVVEYV